VDSEAIQSNEEQMNKALDVITQKSLGSKLIVFLGFGFTLICLKNIFQLPLLL